VYKRQHTKGEKERETETERQQRQLCRTTLV
jgi:hypothetical protein